LHFNKNSTVRVIERGAPMLSDPGGTTHRHRRGAPPLSRRILP